MEKMLPTFLQLTPNNPIFGPNASQGAQDQYYKQAIQPQLNQAAVQQYLGGNLGDANSTFGSTYLGSLAAQGANQAFFSGQDFLNNEINNTLNERSNLFGTDINTQQQQNQLGVNASLGAAGLNQSALQGLNNFNLGGAGIQANMGNDLLNAQTMYNAQKAQSMGNLLGGGLGLLGGGIGSLFGKQLGNLGSSITSGIGNMFGSQPPSGSSNMFNPSNFLSYNSRDY